MFIYLIGNLSNHVMGQHKANYDENKVPQYVLPPLLVAQSGEMISNTTDWERTRRGEILRLFEESVYGKTPGNPVEVSYTELQSNKDFLNGKAVLKEVLVSFKTERGEKEMLILIFLPRNETGPVPLFLGLNFYGNHTAHSDPSITVVKNWSRNSEAMLVSDNQTTDKSRGLAGSRWPVEEILERGYGVATIYSGDLDPDYDDGFQNGIHPLFYDKGQEKPQSDEWGTIGAWAWGLSRALDYFETDSTIDHERVAVLGHSRLGKAALWAAAQDMRFAMVISNNSGCGGAALSRRKFGETVEIINTAFPHWFNGNFVQYNGKEEELPIDQHMLLALAAPRPIYVASAEEDRWADPKGEFLSLYHAGEAYQLFGHPGVTDMPEVNKPVVVGKMGYHIRTGKHDITLYDWERYMDFADKYLKYNGG